MFYLFLQRESATEWIPATADQRSALVHSDKPPELITVLDVSAVPDDDWSREQYLEMRYAGPFYMDWDGDDLSDTIKDFQKTLVKLQEDYGLNLAACKLYATGGRGFHIEVPMGNFIPKVSARGYKQLPAIYAEMARALVTDTTDMRVYTARRGRMWRVENVRRSNGNYKVRITPEEALNMDSELYAKVVSEPRTGVEEEPPTLALGMQVLYAKASDNVEAKLRNVKKSKDESKELAKYGGKPPPTVENIANGKGIRPDAGFNQIALQLAVTYAALKYDETRFLEECQGFIETHSGDGSRYNSPRKRRQALRDMFRYVEGSDLYQYSSGAILAICDEDVKIAASSESDEQIFDDGLDTVDGEGENQGGDEQITDTSRVRVVRITKRGLVSKDKEGNDIAISEVTFGDVRVVRDTRQGYDIGFVLTVIKGGRKPNQYVPADVFSSRSKLDDFCRKHGSGYSGNDIQATLIRTALSQRAEEQGSVMHLVEHEGLVLVDDRAGGKLPAWVHSDGVECGDEDVAKGLYFSPALTSRATFESDLHLASPIELSDSSQIWVESLLHANRADIVGAVLGWMTACFFKPFIVESKSDFPLLHLVGAAGSGKSKTAQVFSQMFFRDTSPELVAAGGGTTQYALKSKVTASTSIPVVLDEYKPLEMGSVRHSYLMQVFRNAYVGAALSAGGVSTDGSSYRDIHNANVYTPIVFIAETAESQTAIVERSVTCFFSKRDQQNKVWRVLERDKHGHFSEYGRLLLNKALNSNTEQVQDDLDNIRDELEPRLERVYGNADSRRLTNLSVILLGLRYAGEAIKSVFGDQFEARFAELEQVFLQEHISAENEVKPEYAKMLDLLSMQADTVPSDSPYALREGYEYAYSDDGNYVDIKMRDTFYRHLAYGKVAGSPVYFGTLDAFTKGFAHQTHLVVDTKCSNSPLRTEASATIFRFDVQAWRAEEVQLLRSKAVQ